MSVKFISDLEDSRIFNRLLKSLQEDYPPKTIQHAVDLENLAYLNWQTQRISALIEADLNQRIRSKLLRLVTDPTLRLLRATRRSLAHREHQLMIKQNEANLRSTNTLVTRVDKWNSLR